MSEGTKPRQQVLDLGLSEILARTESRCGDAGPTRSETAVFALNDGDVAFEREFVSLAEAKKWGVLVSKAEQTIASEDDVEARLWWIRGHLGALSLPVSLLAAPFEATCRQLKPEDAVGVYRNLIEEISQIMLTRLNDVGDVRQARRVSDTLLAIGLDSSQIPSVRGEARRMRVPPLAPVFHAPSNSEQPERPEPAQVVQPRSRAGWLWIGSACAGVAVMLLLGLSMWNSGHVSIVSDSLLSQSSGVAQEWPLVRAREVSGSLGALYYSLAGEKKAEGVSNNVNRQELQDTATSVGSPPTPPRSGDRRDKSASKQKEVVRTDGPLEPKEQLQPRELVPSPVEPQLPAPELAMRGDGTGVKEGEERPSFPDGVAASGSGVRVVLVRTHVLINGSHHAKVLSILEPGDRVQVEGVFGRWLRIRSRKGKVGYVFASDVGEVEDFTSQAGGGRP